MLLTPPFHPSTNLISSIWSIWIFYRLYESFLEKRLLFRKLTIFIVYFCNAFYISFFDSRVSMTNIFYFHFRKFILTLNLSKAQGKWWKLKSDILCRKRGISVDWRIKGIEENYKLCITKGGCMHENWDGTKMSWGGGAIFYLSL